MNNVMQHVKHGVTGRLVVLLVALGVAVCLLLVVPGGAGEAAEQAGTYSAPLQTAISDLPVGTEVRTRCLTATATTSPTPDSITPCSSPASTTGCSAPDSPNSPGPSQQGLQAASRAYQKAINQLTEE